MTWHARPFTRPARPTSGCLACQNPGRHLVGRVWSHLVLAAGHTSCVAPVRGAPRAVSCTRVMLRLLRPCAARLAAAAARRHVAAAVPRRLPSTRASAVPPAGAAPAAGVQVRGITAARARTPGARVVEQKLRISTSTSVLRCLSALTFRRSALRSACLPSWVAARRRGWTHMCRQRCRRAQVARVSQQPSAAGRSPSTAAPSPSPRSR